METTEKESKPGYLPIGAYIRILLVGAILGLVLAKSEAASWDRVHKMFRFEEAHMYLIIGLGIAVAMISMLILKKLHAVSIGGKPIAYKPKPYHKGVIIGGMIFGAGWAITGACPGPIYAQIGGGEWYALITLAGALLGMYSFALLKPRLPFRG
ncbi:MAG: YeeE/YedE thiosulfate transporter family protein [Verrucomicrobiales bacterium]|nr:YeeE/YedE thiosulfate transporter family protein [Verrucomicrobiales bacterium]